MSVSACLTVADSKRAFHAAFPHVIGPLYRRMVDELLVELHLLSRQSGFRSDGLFAVGLTQVFDGFSKGYRPPEQSEPLFVALCASSGFDAQQIRAQHAAAVAAVGEHSLDEVKHWLAQRGKGAPEPIAGVLAGIDRSDFHYSRLFAVGLLSLLQRARGAESMEPQALREAAHEIGESMGLMKERVDKDLTLYASNLQKMAQAVELMEETLAAERRRRERQAQGTKVTPAANSAGETVSNTDNETNVMPESSPPASPQGG
ncbi:photosystem II biogenesis protein Psp29 [Synechococcus sp. Cruz-9H2]|nr:MULTISPECIES: photosystem II biogenesis protein Psp29 [unclassified Synechococcus]MCP9817986.1 photosystem II biogenesis protein Psp29 [Synechococcus sp. Cruz-9H2]MCP9842514.1 photosystem II biogenesis protein Psp29 [Synechococcus sp. Edmonson 11F2]MCP9854382.1 photosystem II biogenesis protein Psp29 [Synechococcus sp. Cruz-9C9]MCP9861922.1 photosystem II biogenesis protein Psp29 [Synechococcus sp. Cruz-7E5]MCP9868894.1 photosystem II biogenesis protein Psp29 [Synechococcus sp. Cruz-7B9]